MLVRGIALLAAALLPAILLAGCGDKTVRSSSGATAATVLPASTYLASDTHKNVTISDMVYVRPDLDALRAKIDDLLGGIDRGKPASELFSDYQAIQADYAHADSMLSLSYLLYALDVTDAYYQNEYAYLQSGLGTLDAAMENVSYQLFTSSNEAESLARGSLGDGYVDSILLMEESTGDSVQQLLDEEEQKTIAYDELSATYTLLDNGRRWTMQEIGSDASLGDDEYYRLYDAYNAGFNARAGAIFLDQLKIRDEIAKTLGYSDYAAYGYDVYERDYTLADAKTLQDAVKTYIVPVFIRASDAADTYDLADASFAQDDFLGALGGVSAGHSPLLGEAVGYMLQNKLYDFAPDVNKMDGSFTTYISDYSAPFIFSQWTGESTDITTILHELGHFTSYYYNAAAGYSATDSIDLAEVDSQALVLLFSGDYGSFYGGLANEAVQDVLLDAMYSLLSGCMEDEFQQAVYQNPSMTLDEMNALYKRLAVEYGLDEVYGYTGTEWTLISHTFQTPMYYISYAVSMVPALELYERAQTDPAGAWDCYFGILERAQYAKLQDVLAQYGLSPVFSADTIKSIADVLDRQFS